MTECFPKTLRGSTVGKVVHNQVHDLVKRPDPSGESKVVRDFLSQPDQVVLKEEIGADSYH